MVSDKIGKKLQTSQPECYMAERVVSWLAQGSLKEIALWGKQPSEEGQD